MTPTHCTRRALRPATSLCVAALVAAGCGSSAVPPESTLPSSDASQGRQLDRSTFASQSGAASDCGLGSVYFAYDSSDLDVRARDALSDSARCLSARQTSQATIVGMADPRGTEEYNLALGERRAQSAKRYLVSLGVETQRLGHRSVGEEMATGSDDTSWSEDRRAEIELR